MKFDVGVEQTFVVMTNGLDRATRESIAYWSGKGLAVRSLVYRVYQTRGGDLLLEVDPYGVEPDSVDVDDAAKGIVVVNTNTTYMPEAWRPMIENQRVSAFYGRKAAVDRIAKDDAVALFHTGVGVIAVGRATGPVQIGDVGEDLDEEHWVPCKFDYVVSPEADAHRAVKAHEINEHLDSSHRFRQTVYTLPNEVIEFITAAFVKKGVPKRGV